MRWLTGELSGSCRGVTLRQLPKRAMPRQQQVLLSGASRRQCPRQPPTSSAHLLALVLSLSLSIFLSLFYCMTCVRFPPMSRICWRWCFPIPFHSPFHSPFPSSGVRAVTLPLPLLCHPLCSLSASLLHFPSIPHSTDNDAVECLARERLCAFIAVQYHG